MIKTVPYIGNGAYCYANCVAMLLASAGENITPSVIEVLNGVGLGACIYKNYLFFSWEHPSNGIDSALTLPGFKYKKVETLKSKQPPFGLLTTDLKQSPSIIGPLDMGCLTYNPNYYYLRGADHFILAYGINDNQVFLHDPGGSSGFPCVSISFTQLTKAWKANVGYGEDYYCYWTKPKRIAKPHKDDIYKSAINLFKILYKKCSLWSVNNKKLTGGQAIIFTAERIRIKKIKQTEIDQLMYFALPLGARRALDFALFFDFKDKDLADLKRQQAVLFGQCQTLAMAKKWLELSDYLTKLAETEELFQKSILDK